MANEGSSNTPTPVDTDSNSNPTPSVQEEAVATTRRKTDPAWGFCTQFIQGGRKKIRCMFCNMVIAGGGIHRFKEHLAKVPGNIAACGKVSAEVQYEMHQHIKEGMQAKGRHRKTLRKSTHMGQNLQKKKQLVRLLVQFHPSLLLLQAEEEKEDVLLLVLASISSPEQAQEINLP